MLMISLTCCKQKTEVKTANLDLAESQINFLSKLKHSEGLIRRVQTDTIKRSQIISQLDNYLVDSVRQFKGWQFEVETIKAVTLSGAPSYSIDLSCPVPGDSTHVNFHYTVPKNPSEQDLVALEEVSSKLSPGDIVEMNGVIFMTDPTMEIITLADYFDPVKPKKLYLIPIKLEKRD